VDINPFFFWPYYNLGVIYFQMGDYVSSAKILSKALSLKKEITLEILYQSPFYRQIWRKIPDPPQTLENNLDQGRQDAALLLAACFLKARAYDQVLKFLQSSALGGSWHQDLLEQIRQKAANKQAQTDDLTRLIQKQIPVRLF
jgi:tetratricopeptide (TPR) repeat protein